MLELDADTTGLQGAEYNPREIAEEDLQALRESINRLGIVKPIIARGKTIVAGHQRTKSLRAIGVHRAPVYWLGRETTTFDEVRFNQLHNGTDLDFGDEFLSVTGPLAIGHNQVRPDQIAGNFRGVGAMVRIAIADLIGKYGPWGACVASPDGKVIHAAQYAIAAAVSGVPVDVFVVPEEQVEFARRMLARQYGKFSYNRIERKTYIQCLAQPPRPAIEGKTKLSRLYRHYVMPHLESNPGARVLDFGAGRGECARQARDSGHNVKDLEFFRQTNHREINKAAVHRMIQAALGEVRRNGQFDAVVCQAVLNSVDTIEAQDAVVACCSLFCREGGTLIINGRSVEDLEISMKLTKADGQSRRPEFLDEDNFSAIYRDGEWFFQKYHTLSQAIDLIKRFGFEIESAIEGGKIRGYWTIVAKKVAALEPDRYRRAVEFEFELPWPDGTRVGMSEQVKQVFGLA